MSIHRLSQQNTYSHVYITINLCGQGRKHIVPKHLFIYSFIFSDLIIRATVCLSPTLSILSTSEQWSIQPSTFPCIPSIKAQVLTGTMASTVWAWVCLNRTSMKEMTCSVFPRPMLWARIQPNPELLLNRSTDSTRLSYRKRIPPIWGGEGQGRGGGCSNGTKEGLKEGKRRPGA